jgi:hypothetical protein
VRLVWRSLPSPLHQSGTPFVLCGDQFVSSCERQTFVRGSGSPLTVRRSS